MLKIKYSFFKIIICTKYSPAKARVSRLEAPKNDKNRDFVVQNIQKPRRISGI